MQPMGFIKGSNTQVEIAFEVNHIRQDYCFAAVLDVKNTYNTVSQVKLKQLLEECLPMRLSSQFIALLTPMSPRIQLQTVAETALGLARVAQGDPVGPLIFDICAEPYLERLSTIRDGVASCLSDDVLLLASNQAPLQQQLDASTELAHSTGMRWSPAKLEAITTESVPIASVLMSQVSEVNYLGLSHLRTSLEDGTLRGRSRKALSLL